MHTLCQIFDSKLSIDNSSFFRDKVPASVSYNLKSSYQQRAYQQEALGRFIYYWEEYKSTQKNQPTHLLYHMATGSGKTLIMAGLIIYLYKMGFRNFIFFVHSNNIIDKTRDNFLNSQSNKYLFAEEISIVGKSISIKEVNNFQVEENNHIQIIFTTIQGLHSRLNSPKENSATYTDFEKQQVVLLSDEAHHINAQTKRSKDLNAIEQEEMISWEGTVNQILNSNSQNVLLEFTATADFSNAEIKRKYSDKLIFDFSLKQFRKEGYSKEVKVLQTDLPPFGRALQAVILSQYRQKVFEKNKIICKPVILFKSRTITESQAFFQEFIAGIRHLKSEDLQLIKNQKLAEPIAKAFRYFEDQQISLSNLVTELKVDFAKDKLLSINSKEESESKQLAVNNLEDADNPYRAIFAVDKLNEGWDVLNLFDIVRLYETKNASSSKLSKTTVAEAQLIGRGARYFPFRLNHKQLLFKRKFDDALENEMRIGEELYYHNAYNPEYIKELSRALVTIGIRASEEEMKQPIARKNLNSQNLDKKLISLFPLNRKFYSIHLNQGFSEESVAFDEVSDNSKKTFNQKVCLLDFEYPIIRKAFQKVPFYQFTNLKKYIPDLESMEDLYQHDKYIGNVGLQIEKFTEPNQVLTAKEKLRITTTVLDQIANDFLKLIQINE